MKKVLTALLLLAVLVGCQRIEDAQAQQEQAASIELTRIYGDQWTDIYRFVDKGAVCYAWWGVESRLALSCFPIVPTEELAEYY